MFKITSSCPHLLNNFSTHSLLKRPICHFVNEQYECSNEELLWCIGGPIVKKITKKSREES